MTLPVSGAISFNNINVELGVAGTTQASLGQSSYRTLAGVPSGQISMNNFYGKSNRTAVSYTFSSNTANASLNLSSLGGYTAGTTDFTVTVGSGIYLYATSTGNYGLNLTGATTGDTVTLVNNGFIMGQGGNGSSSPTAGSGGPALNVGIGTNITINNTNASAYIGGGGGAGSNAGFGGGGGGAGGGAGGPISGAAGGSGGSIGSSGANGEAVYCETSTSAGGGGGRIFPGTGGAKGIPASGGGAGGGGGGNSSVGGSGGNGGSGNAAGSAGGDYGGGGGGGWGASGGVGGYFTPGSGGKAVNLNGKTVTWTSGNTTRVYGTVS